MTFLPRRSFAVWWKNLERWVIPARSLLARQLPEGWFIVPVRELVRQVSKRVKVETDKEYKMIGVKWYGEGTFHRETVSRDTINATYVTPVKANAFIYNRLFAWKGSFAIVPEEHRGYFVSNEFPQFVVDELRILPRYLYLFFMCDRTVKAVEALSIGSAAVSRNRFKEEEFLDCEIPLPPISVQLSIVKQWERAQTEIATRKQQIFRMEEQIEDDFLTALGLSMPARTPLPKVFAVLWEDSVRWGVRSNQLAATSIDITHGKFSVMTGRDCLVEIKHGCSASPSRKPTTLEVLKISAVTRGVFSPDERKFIDDSQRYRREFDLKAGDVLVCRTNGTLSLVGMSALVEHDMPDLIFPDKVIRVRCKSNIFPAYLWKVLQMPFVRSQIEAAARTAVGNYAIGSKESSESSASTSPTRCAATAYGAGCRAPGGD